MRQVAQQSIGGRHDSVADVRVKLPLIEKLDVVDTFRWIVWNVLRCPVEILSWTGIDTKQNENIEIDINNNTTIYSIRYHNAASRYKCA